LSSNTNKKDNKQKQQPSQKKNNNDISNEEEIIIIDDTLKEATDKALKDFNMDVDTNKDLVNVELPDIEMSEKQLDDIVKDTTVKKIYKEPHESPTIEETLGTNEQYISLTKDEINDFRDQMNQDRQSMLMLLAAKPYIKLHLKTGMVDGKTMWIEKKFYFNSITKREDLGLRLKLNRSEDIKLTYQQTLSKPSSELTQKDYKFLKECQYILDVANFEMQAYEAKLRMGMSYEDFSRCNMDEYTFALQVINWRTIAPPFSKLKQ